MFTTETNTCLLLGQTKCMFKQCFNFTLEKGFEGED